MIMMLIMILVAEQKNVYGLIEFQDVILIVKQNAMKKGLFGRVSLVVVVQELDTLNQRMHSDDKDL